MSGRDLAEDLHRAAQQFGLEAIAKLLTLTNKRNMPLLENISLRHWVTFSPLIDKHTQQITIAGPSVTDPETAGQGNPLAYMRRINARLKVFQILTSWTGGNPIIPLSNLKWAGKGIFDGTKYASCTPYSTTTDMDMGSDAFGIAFWFKSSSSNPYGIICKRNVAAGAGFIVKIDTSTNQVIAQISDGTLTNTLTAPAGAITLNDGLWHAIHVNFPKTGNIEVFVDGVSKGTLTRTAVSVTNSRTCYIGARDNGGTIDQILVGSLSWFVWKRTIWTAQNITDYITNGLLDHAYGNQQRGIAALKLWYKLENDAKDASGNGDDGTWTGTPVYESGQVGQAAVFDGTKYITVPNESHFDFENNMPFSISLWFKTSYTATDQYMISKKVAGNAGSIGYSIRFYNGTNKIICNICTATTFHEVLSTSVLLQDGTWHHCVFTFSGNGNQNGMKLYVDGVLDATGITATIPSTILNNLAVIVGRANASLPFNGDLDEVMIFNTEKTAEEIWELYQSGKVAKDEVLTLPLMFDEKPYSIAWTGEFRAST